MKPLPQVVLEVLAHLPNETHEVRLHTDGRGKWTVEACARYRVQEPSTCPDKGTVVTLMRGSKSQY